MLVWYFVDCYVLGWLVCWLFCYGFRCVMVGFTVFVDGGWFDVICLINFGL